jgi:chromosome partitioning protein
MKGRNDVVATSGSDERLARTVAVINGKGGVGKTSVTANVAGQLASAGYRVLAVDLDLSGNLKLDLGYIGHPGDDDGKGLVDAIWSGGDIPLIAGVRDNLDVIPGGRHLEMLAALAQSPVAQDLPGGGVAAAFAAKLAALADGYDLVLLDCAPGNPVLQDMALAATRYVLIPTKTDAAGWDGLRMVGPRVKKARRDNPQLTYLGVVLFAHQTNATRILKSTQARLAEVGDLVPVFDAFIRHSETAAHDCRARGQLAHELARDATASRRQRLALLRDRRGGGNVIALPASLSASADSLAGDYERLTREMLLRISDVEQGTVAARTGQ